MLIWYQTARGKPCPVAWWLRSGSRASVQAKTARMTPLVRDTQQPPEAAHLHTSTLLTEALLLAADQD
jgi:hypothetical protein